MNDHGSAATHFGANTVATEHKIISTLTNTTIETGSNVLNLAHENASLREQVTSLLALVKSLEATLKLTNVKLEALMSAQTPAPQPGDGGGKWGKGKGKRIKGPANGYDPNSKHYCHTHGLTRNSNHTSTNCRNPGPNHVRDATFRNRKNGSDYLCHLAETPASPDTNHNIQ